MGVLYPGVQYADESDFIAACLGAITTERCFDGSRRGFPEMYSTADAVFGGPPVLVSSNLGLLSAVISGIVFALNILCVAKPGAYAPWHFHNYSLREHS